MSTEQKVRALCAEITPPDQTQADRILTHLETRFGSLRSLGALMAAAQRIAPPASRIKGLALFASERPGCPQIPAAVRQFLNDRSPAQTLLQQHDVKAAVVDVGLADERLAGETNRQIMRPRWKTSGLSPVEMVWESLQAGIRAAYLMKGKGTDLFGTNCFGDVTEWCDQPEELARTAAWDVSAMTGFILAGANLQTPIVVSGRSGILAARLAIRLCPHVRDYLIVAQPDAAESLNIKPLFHLELPDTLAVITALGLCESAARLCQFTPVSRA